MPKYLRRLLIVYLPLALLGAVASLIGAAMVSGGVIIMSAGGSFGPIGLFAIAHAVKRHRRRRDLMALTQIEQAVRLNLPLSRMLPAAAAAESGRLAVNLRGIDRELEQGTALSEAIRLHLTALPEETHATISAGEMAACLDRRLAEAVEEERRQAREDQSREPLAIVYPVLLVVSLISMIGFVGLFMVPKYAKIFEDFEIPLPVLTTTVFAVADSWSHILFAVGLFCVAMVVIWSIGTMAKVDILAVFRSRLMRRLAWHVPLLHAVERDRGLADVFDLMADALHAGHTTPLSIQLAEDLHINPVLQGRIRRWRIAVESGAPLCDAARLAKLPAIAVSMIRTGESSVRLPEVFRFLARWHRSRFGRLAQMLRAWALPLITILLAAVIGLFVLAVFLPLPRLIDYTAMTAF